MSQRPPSFELTPISGPDFNHPSRLVILRRRLYKGHQSVRRGCHGGRYVGILGVSLHQAYNADSHSFVHPDIRDPRVDPGSPQRSS